MTIGASGAAARGGQPLLIVTGLLREARIAAGPGMTVICSSSDPRQLRAQLAAFNPASVRGIISFGVAGGLCPSLQPGDVVIASKVVTAEKCWLASTAFNAELTASLDVGHRKVLQGILVGVEQVVCDQRAKAALRHATGAVAVDMESHIAADSAEAMELPFAALRVVSDPATRNLPTLAIDALKPNGNIDAWKVLRGIARRPDVIPSLMRTARDFNQAIDALRGCRSLLLGGERLVAADI